MKRQSGMVLVVVLIFIALITLLLFYSVDSIQLQQMINDNDYHSLQSSQAAQRALYRGFQALISGNVDCQKPLFSVAAILAKPSTWWQQLAVFCGGNMNGHHFQYYVTKLQQNPCARFSNGKIAQYWQITARGSYHQRHVVILQATVALAVPSSKSCATKTRLIHHTWQSFCRLR